jgi:hypothetical protein
MRQVLVYNADVPVGKVFWDGMGNAHIPHQDNI